jgi:glycosyltransferase involved in cell wall biosynthesis
MEVSHTEAVQQPFISIVITAYNRGEFISDCILSALKFQPSESEIVIVDDCSQDDTWALIRKYQSENKRIRAYRNEQNLGQFPNRNKAAKLAKGKYIQFLDSDDTLDHLKLNEVKSLLEKHNWDICMFHEEIQSYQTNPVALLRTQLLKHPILNCGPTGMTIDRDLFESLGGFSSQYGVAGDVEFNLRAVLQSKRPGIHSIPFFFYRRHEGQEIHHSVDYAIYPRVYVRELLNNTQSLNRLEKHAVSAAFARRFIIDLFKSDVRRKTPRWISVLVREIISSFSIPIKYLPSAKERVLTTDPKTIT